MTNKVRRFWLALVSVVLVLAMTVPALADTGFDGNSGDGSAGTTTSSWNVPTGSDEHAAIVGYRFTVVEPNGDLVSGSHAIDVYISDNKKANCHLGGGSSYTVKIHKDYEKNNKVWYYDHYNSVDFSASGAFSSSATDSTNIFLDSELNQTLSYDPSTMGSKLTESFKSKIATKCAVPGGTLRNTMLILVEPLYIASLGGTYYIMTTSEWAIYMTNVWIGPKEGNANKWNKHMGSYGSNTFSNIDCLVTTAQPSFLYVTGYGVTNIAYNADNAIYFGKIKVPKYYENNQEKWYVQTKSSWSGMHGQYSSGTAFCGPNEKSSSDHRNAPIDLIQYGVGLGIYWAKGVPPSGSNVTIYFYEDGQPASRYRQVNLKLGNTTYYTLTQNSYSYSWSSVVSGTYDVYVSGTDTGVDITVTSGTPASAAVHSYSLTTTKTSGISSISQKVLLPGSNSVFLTITNNGSQITMTGSSATGVATGYYTSTIFTYALSPNILGTSSNTIYSSSGSASTSFIFSSGGTATYYYFVNSPSGNLIETGAIISIEYDQNTLKVMYPYSTNTVTRSADINATIASGSTWQNWSGTTTYSSQSTTGITVDQAKHETANATPNTCTVTVTTWVYNDALGEYVKQNPFNDSTYDKVCILGTTYIMGTMYPLTWTSLVNGQAIKIGVTPGTTISNQFFVYQNNRFSNYVKPLVDNVAAVRVFVDGEEIDSSNFSTLSITKNTEIRVYYYTVSATDGAGVIEDEATFSINSASGTQYSSATVLANTNVYFYAVKEDGYGDTITWTGTPYNFTTTTGVSSVAKVINMNTTETATATAQYTFRIETYVDGVLQNPFTSYNYIYDDTYGVQYNLTNGVYEGIHDKYGVYVLNLYAPRYQGDNPAAYGTCISDNPNVKWYENGIEVSNVNNRTSYFNRNITIKIFYYTITLKAATGSQISSLSIINGSNNNTVTSNTPYTFISGTILSVSATMSDTTHYNFQKWRGTYTTYTWNSGYTATTASTESNTDLTSNPISSVSVDRKKVFTAYTIGKFYKVTINVSPAGYGTVSQSEVTAVPYGTVLRTSVNSLYVDSATSGTTTVTASPISSSDYTYYFSSWTNGTVTVTGNTTVTANFGRFAITGNPTVYFKLDGSDYSLARTVKLCQSGTVKYTHSTTSAAASYAFTSVAPGTYDVYVGNTDTNVDIVVTTSGGTATVNYYTVTVTAGDYISSVSGSGVYLKGTSPAISASKQTTPAYSDSTGQTYASGKATITIYKDGSLWDPNGTSTAVTMKLNNSGSAITVPRTGTGTYVSGEVTPGTYRVYVGGVDTGVNVTVNNGTKTIRTNYSYSFVNWTKNTSGNDLVSATSASTNVNGLTMTSAYRANGSRSSSTEDRDKVAGGSSGGRVDYFTVTVNTNPSGAAYGYVNNTDAITYTVLKNSIISKNGDKLYVQNHNDHNILVNGDLTSDTSGWASSSGWSIVTEDGLNAVHVSGTKESTKWMRQSIYDQIKDDPDGQVYLLTAQVKVKNYSAGTTNPYVALYFDGTYNNGGSSTWMGGTYSSSTLYNASNPGSGWITVSYRISFAHKPTSMYFFLYARDFTGDFYVRNVGLTKIDNVTTVNATAKTATAQYTYAFSDWINGIVTVTGSTTVTANFTRSVNPYNLTIQVYKDGAAYSPTNTVQLNGSTISFSSGTYGTTLDYGSTYTIKAASTPGANSYPNTIATGTISGNTVVRIDYYTLTVNPNGGTYNSSTSNSTVVMLKNLTSSVAAPTRAGYTFLGWVESGDGYLDASHYVLSDGSLKNGAVVSPYNNSENGQVAVTRGSGTISDPLYSAYALTNYDIITNLGGTTSPGRGGWVKYVSSAADHQYVVMFIAKVSTGYTLNIAANSTGTGGHAVRRWLTGNEGTGEWALYAYELVAGSTGTFSTCGYTYLNKTTGADAYEVLLGYHNIVDLGTTYGTPDYNSTYTYAGSSTLTAAWVKTSKDIDVTKTWNDNGNPDNTRGSGATVRLVGKNSGGTPVYSDSRAIAANATSAKFTNVPAYEGILGDALTYTLTEDAMTGYTTTISGSYASGSYAVTNTIKQYTLTINVYKNGSAYNPSNTIQVNGEANTPNTSGVITVTVNHGATYTVNASNVPGSSAYEKTIETGTMDDNKTVNVYYYTVSVTAGDYISSVSQESSDGIYLKDYKPSISATVQTAPTYSDATGQTYEKGIATVYIYKDETTLYDPSGTSTAVTIKYNNTGDAISLTRKSTGVYKSSETEANYLTPGTYRVYVDGVDTGVNVTVNNGTKTIRTNYTYTFNNWTKNTTGNDLVKDTSTSDVTAYKVNGLTMTSAYKANGNRSSSTEDRDKVPGGSTGGRVDYYSVTLSKDSNIKSVSGDGTYLKGTNPSISAIANDTVTHNAKVTVTVKIDGTTPYTGQTVKLRRVSDGTVVNTTESSSGVYTTSAVIPYNVKYEVWLNPNDSFTEGNLISTVKNLSHTDYSFTNWTKNTTGTNLTNANSAATTVNSIAMASAYKANGSHVKYDADGTSTISDGTTPNIPVSFAPVTIHAYIVPHFNVAYPAANGRTEIRESLNGNKFGYFKKGSVSSPSFDGVQLWSGFGSETTVYYGTGTGTLTVTWDNTLKCYVATTTSDRGFGSIFVKGYKGESSNHVAYFYSSDGGLCTTDMVVDLYYYSLITHGDYGIDRTGQKFPNQSSYTMGSNGVYSIGLRGSTVNIKAEVRSQEEYDGYVKPILNITLDGAAWTGQDVDIYEGSTKKSDTTYNASKGGYVADTPLPSGTYKVFVNGKEEGTFSFTAKVTRTYNWNGWNTDNLIGVDLSNQ